jgi:hypothetical protein
MLSNDAGDADDLGTLIPNKEFLADLHLSEMQGWRNDRDPEMIALGWPLPIKRGTDKFAPVFRWSNQIKRFKEQLAQLALENRKALLAKARKAEEAAA